MTYDEAAHRRTGDEQGDNDPAAYRRRIQYDDTTSTTVDQAVRAVSMPAVPAAAEDDGRDRIGVHLGWEVVLLVVTAVLAFFLYREDPASLQRPAMDTLLVTGAAIGLLALGAGLTVRAGVPNLALGPILVASQLHFAENGDDGLLPALLPALAVAAAAAAVVAIVVLAFHVPGWAATLAAALGVIVFIQLRIAPVAVQGDFDPTGHAFFYFGGFALLAVLGGGLGAIGPVRRFLGRMRAAADPARRRGAAVVLPVLTSLVVSSLFAVGAGVLLAAVAERPIVPGTGLEWTGIALGLALLAGTSAYGRRGGIFGTLFAVTGLTLFLDFAARRDLDVALFATAGAVLAAGLIVTRLVETYGRSLPAGDEDWSTPPTGAGAGATWSPGLPETWATPAAPAARAERWDDGPWGANR